MLLVAGLLIGLGGSLAFYVQTKFSETLTEELLKRGVSIARQLAENGSSALITDDRITLSRLAHSSRESETDIVYTFFLGPHENEVLAHSFGEHFPIDLLTTSPEGNFKQAAIKKLITSSGIVYDISAPVISRNVGIVRLGISANAVTEAVDNLTQQITTVVGTLLLVAIIIGIPIARAISNPISQLTKAAERLSRRERSEPVTVRTRGEIGQLAKTFNVMAENLMEAEEKLANQVSFLETLLADLPEPVFYKDKTGAMLGCNHAFESFFAVKAEEIIGHTSYIYRPEPEAAVHVARDKDVLLNNKRVSYEMRIERHDGLLRDVIFHKVPIINDNGMVNGLIGVMQDITEEREASRLKSEFVTTAAHEFQTPLASILGFSELILADSESFKEDLPEFIRLIFSKASFLSHLVDEMLNLSRIESGRGIALRKTECVVNEEVARIIENFKLLYPDYNFQLIHPEESEILVVDKERMGQVVDNLLQNAVKYSGKGSTIEITIEDTETHCIVSTADRGIGMSEEQMAQATEKFYRGDTSNTAPGGAGLGLFISQSIVDAHGGTLTIESIKNQGTTVTFRIPYEQPKRELHVPKTSIQISHVEH